MSEWTERPVYTPVPSHDAEEAGATGESREPDESPLQRDSAAEASESAIDDVIDDIFGASAAPVPKDALEDSESAPSSDATALFRAENEDDDGYDPYSDWHDQGVAAPLFERDPWE